MTQAELLEKAYERTQRKIQLYKNLYPNEPKYQEEYYFWLVFEDVTKQVLLEDVSIKRNRVKYKTHSSTSKRSN